MTSRLLEIYSRIPYCRAFADVGCDHGYIAKAMLEGGKCDRAVVSDVSAKCLMKAEKLLCGYISQGKAVSCVSDGFSNIPPVDCALIAGMGGEEIVKILDRAPFLPEKLVLQPMKNCDKVRECAVSKGYKIVSDYTFIADGGFYVIISLEKGEDSLSEEEKEFGRTNVEQRPEAFLMWAEKEAEKQRRFAMNERLSEQQKQMFCNKAERLERYVGNRRTDEDT